MILVTTESIAGRPVAQTLGIVRGNAVRSRSLYTRIIASLKHLVGGEIDEYTKLMAECREQALDRMVAEARAQGADAVLGLRFASSEISAGAAEFMAYGTAVRLVAGTSPKP